MVFTGILIHYNEDAVIYVDEKKSIIFTTVHPTELVFPRGYFFEPRTTYVLGPNNTKYTIKMQ